VSDEFDPLQALRVALQEGKTSILYDIAGHPHGAISIEEIAYTSPRLDEDVIHDHLHALIAVGVVEEQVLEPKQREPDLPYHFYRYSEQGRDLFETTGLVSEDTLKSGYETVEKTPRIHRLEEAPRPNQ
jgi:predicted ArsR family transcriptional regulator